MATLNVENLLTQINLKISKTTDNKELLMLSKALTVLKTGVIFTVGTFGNLPSASENVGKLYFVESDSLLYFAFTPDYVSSYIWIPIVDISANFAWTWGSNNGNQLGTGISQCPGLRCSPGTVVGNDSDWINVQVSDKSNAFGGTSMGIKCDGTLWTWGSGTCGALGNGFGVARCSPGTVVGGGTWMDIDGGDCFSMGLKCDGTLWTWGSGLSGRLGDGTTVCRCSPGTVAGGGTTWCQIGPNGGIKTDGTLWTWGSGSVGQLGDGTTVSRFSPGTIFGNYTNWSKIEKSSVFDTSSAIKTDGTLWTWGSNSQGKLGDGTTVSRCSPGTVAGGGTTWIESSGGNNMIIALKTDGTLWTWGNNSCGQLGDGTTIARCSPGTVAGGDTTWCKISAGNFANAAIKTDGTLWTWGSNCFGVLGDGTTVSRCSPGTTSGCGNKWWDISSGGAFMIGLSKETL